jgi:hypothetical protein
MLWAGLAMLVAWIFIEILLEYFMAQIILGQTSAQMWLEAIDLPELTGVNYGANGLIALMNSTLMIWLYASLRPMYGVGVKTALITSAFAVIVGFSLFVNWTNLGVLPVRPALIEGVFEAIEFPLAMLVGAAVYEGGMDDVQKPE